MRGAADSSLDMRPRKRMLILAALLVATWPVWRWMAARFADGSGDTWELLAALTVIVVLIRDSDAPPALVKLTLPAALLLAYAATCGLLSPLPRGMLAMATIGAAASALWYGKRVDVAICGLLLISLPVMASLNFYLGYPLRVAAGSIAAALLQMNGIAAVREGAQLVWDGRSVAIDAPCSGVKMLWAGAYLSFALSAMMRLSARRTVVLALLSVVVVIVANAIRATSLFYVEAGIFQGPELLHEAIGLVMFAFAAVALFTMARKLAGYAHAH
ncbi:MAG: archaeosortase/exosortase family protein [Pseudomonadota bacterium]|nr:archaeosortase/exosortase family protein [Pseudomonadota bacterium]